MRGRPASPVSIAIVDASGKTARRESWSQIESEEPRLTSWAPLRVDATNSMVVRAHKDASQRTEVEVCVGVGERAKAP